MKFIPGLVIATFALGLAGCGSITYERARFDGNRVSNPTLGRGVYYEIPAAYSLLNPHSPVPPKRENWDFERYIRRLAIANDTPSPHLAFTECILFRAEDRYLLLVHVSQNRAGTFRGMHPATRKLLYPDLAAYVNRRLEIPPEDFGYTFEDRAGRAAIVYAPFEPGRAGSAAPGWKGVGYSMLGDVTDILHIFAFAREKDLDAARADLEALNARISYGKPLP